MKSKTSEALAAQLEGRMADTSRTIETLSAAARSDEANLQKAVRNVYGICHQLLLCTESLTEYTAQLDKLQAAWIQSRALADSHQDFAKVTLEDLKLGALQDAFTLLQQAQEVI